MIFRRNEIVFHCPSMKKNDRRNKKNEGTILKLVITKKFLGSPC
jgi:hypothetical protein